MAIVANVCNSFRQELLAMTPHTAGDVYKIALYTSSATLSKSTTAYSATNEVGNSGTYAAGGQTLVGFTVTLDTDTAILDWTTDPVWTGATITARGALIYNSTRSNKALAVLDFAADITSTNGTFTVTFPVAAVGIVVPSVSGRAEPVGMSMTATGGLTRAYDLVVVTATAYTPVSISAMVDPRGVTSKAVVGTPTAPDALDHAWHALQTEEDELRLLGVIV